MNQILEVHCLFNPFSTSIPYWGKLLILISLYSFLITCAISICIRLKQIDTEQKSQREIGTAHFLEVYDKLKAIGGGAIVVMRPFLLDAKAVKDKQDICCNNNISISVIPAPCFTYSEQAASDSCIFFGWF